VSLLANSLLTLSCQVKRAGGIDGQAGTDNSGCSLSLNKTNYPSNAPSTFVSAPYICSAKRASPLGEVGFTAGGSRVLRLRPARLLVYAHRLLLSRMAMDFSGVGTGNPWMVTSGNGVRRDASLQVWEKLPACLWRELRGKHEPPRRAMVHTRRSPESTRKLKSSGS